MSYNLAQGFLKHFTHYFDLFQTAVVCTTNMYEEPGMHLCWTTL